MGDIGGPSTGADIQCISLLRTNLGHGWVGEDPSIQEFHDIEGCPHDAVIFTETIGFRDGDIGLLEGVDDLVFALDFMRRLRQQLAGRFLAQYIFLSIGGDQLVGGIRLSETELLRCWLAIALGSRRGLDLGCTCLLHLQRGLYNWHVLVDIALQRRDVDRLAYGSSHDEQGVGIRGVLDELEGRDENPMISM